MILVTTPHGLFDEYESGSKWHIDEDDCMLHVLDANKRGLASYAPGCWSSVRTVE